MPWEQVGRRRYYSRSEWAAGRAVRRYVGTGPAAAADDLRRLERVIGARERRAEQDRHREAETPLLELCGLTDLLTRVALVAAGYHRHDRGAWRRRGRQPQSQAGPPPRE
jgi:hypothetical protein